MASTLHTCRACQRRLLDAVTSLASASLKPARHSFYLNRASQPITEFHKKRPIHTSSIRWQQHQSRESSIPKLDELVLEESASQQSESQPSTSSCSTTTPTSRSDSSHIPWYLSVAPPTPLAPTSSSPSSIANLELPPLPENPPSILEPILTHLSLSIGLDNLTLLDLRNLNPPSALGSNLLMILGTARSEKHLNTSADRFCRWLRATYHLRPYADGLLGRNELKLKLRRRNRKMKLAQSVGNTTYDKTDDGITTGWICCNLGAVDVDVSGKNPALEDAEGEEDGPLKELHPTYSAKDQERFLDDEDEYKNPHRDAVEDSDFKYRGFGSATNAPRIVVQMFTEAKRVEVDLEGLWESRIKRREEKEERRQAHFDTQMEDEFETRRIEDEVERPTAREGDREDRVIAGMRAS